MPMDFNVVTLEIADHIVHFDYYDRLVSETGRTEELAKIKSKSKEHLAEFFADAEFYDKNKLLRPLFEMRGSIAPKLVSMKPKDIHALIEKLEKDAKKIKKLYKSLAKK